MPAVPLGAWLTEDLLHWLRCRSFAGVASTATTCRNAILIESPTAVDKPTPAALFAREECLDEIRCYV
jgi:hypothetical protein